MFRPGPQPTSIKNSDPVSICAAEISSHIKSLAGNLLFHANVFEVIHPGSARDVAPVQRLSSGPVPARCE